MQADRHGKRVPVKTEASKRSIDLPEWLVEDLKLHVDTHNLKGSSFIFYSARGRRLHYSNWRQRVWEPACEATGFPELRFHDLRSLNATSMVEEGVNVKVAQERLGHARVTTTLGIYARATSKGLREAADVLGERLRPE
jgi:integrase